MNANLKASDRVAVLAVIAAGTHANGVHSSGWVDMSVFETALVVATAGALAGTATLTLEQALDAEGAAAKAVLDRAPLAMVANKPALLDLSVAELDVNAGFRYVRASLTVAGGDADVGLVVQGLDARYQPAESMAGTVIG